SIWKSVRQSQSESERAVPESQRLDDLHACDSWTTSSGRRTVSLGHAEKIASCSARRTSWIPSPSRVGCTRLVRITTYRSFDGSIHSDVPVNPVWPIALADIFVPHDDVGSIVSHA